MSVRVHVTRTIRFQFDSPPVRVRLGQNTMLRTTMPETAIDEDGHTLSSEHQVRTTTRHAGQRHIDAITKAPRMEFPTNRKLWCRIAPTSTTHSFRN